MESSASREYAFLQTTAWLVDDRIVRNSKRKKLTRGRANSPCADTLSIFLFLAVLLRQLLLGCLRRLLLHDSTLLRLRPLWELYGKAFRQTTCYCIPVITLKGDKCILYIYIYIIQNNYKIKRADMALTGREEEPGRSFDWLNSEMRFAAPPPAGRSRCYSSLPSPQTAVIQMHSKRIQIPPRWLIQSRSLSVDHMSFRILDRFLCSLHYWDCVT